MAMGPHAESEAEVLEKHDTHGAARRLAVSIVTPTGSILARDADEVIAPGVEGEFGVLPGHVPFLSALKPGVLVVRSGKDREIFAVASGYLQVGAGGSVRVLVDQAVRPAAIDAATVNADRTSAEADLRALAQAHDGGAPASGRREAEARLAWANAQLAALHAAGGAGQAK